jgi:hypothetical protein
VHLLDALSIEQQINMILSDELDDVLDKCGELGPWGLAAVLRYMMTMDSNIEPQSA